MSAQPEAPQYASDWEDVSRRLAVTLRSLMQQTCDDWRMLVVGEVLPDLSNELKDRVHFVRADLDIDYPDQRGRREVDKERKQYCGFVELHELSPQYVMPLDFDDAVNVRLVEYAFDHPQYDAFVLKRGFVYVDGARRCQYSRQISMRTGSNFIVRFRAELFPRERSSFSPPLAGYRDWPFVASHIKRPDQLFEQLQLSYVDLPFPAVIWRRSAGSISNAFASPNALVASKTDCRFPSALRGVGRRLRSRLLSRRLTPNLCKSFGCDPGTGFGLPLASTR